MDNIVNIMIYLTLTMSVTILFIFCVKIVFEKKLSPRFNVMLWLILLVRVAFPVLPESPTSIFNVIDISEIPEIFDSGNSVILSEEISEEDEENDNSAKKRNTYILAEAHLESSENITVDEDSYDLESEFTEIKTKIPSGSIPVYHNESKENKGFPYFLVYVYVIGFAAVSTFSIFSYKDVKRKLLETASRNENQYFSDSYENALEITGLKGKKHPVLYTGDSSVLLGVKSPVIIIDRHATPEEADMIILHELNHYMNFDNFYLFVSSLICCVFWFNPLVWIALHSLRFDLELFCDYKTLSKSKIRKDQYAMLLFNRVDGKRLLSPISAMSAAGRQLKSRIKSIARIKNGKYLPKVICASLAFVLCALCLTNPIMSQSEDKKIYMGNFKTLTGYSGEIPAENSPVTAEQFYGMLLIALGSVDMGESEITSFTSYLGNGSFDQFIENALKLYTFDESAEKFLADNLKADTILTREKAAFILDMVMNLRDLKEQSIPESFGGKEFKNVLANLTESEREIVNEYYEKTDMKYSDNQNINKMSEILKDSQLLVDYIEEISVKYVLKQNISLNNKLKLYNIFKNNSGQNSFLSGIIGEAELYYSGYIAKIDVIVFEEEILPYIDNASDLEYIKSIYEYDNEGYYRNISKADENNQVTNEDITKMYYILAAALNLNGNSTLKNEVLSKNTDKISEYIPLIEYMPEDVYRSGLKILNGSDLEYFKTLYPLKGNSKVPNVSAETYTIDEYNEFKSIITEKLDLDKFNAFYTIIDNSLSSSSNKEYLKEINLRERYPQYGDKEKYYLRDPYINEREISALNSILEKYIPGNKDNVYYLKQLTGDDGEYENITDLYRKIGITPDQAYDINAYTGCVADVNRTEGETETYYRKSDYDKIKNTISDQWTFDKFNSFYTEKNFTSNEFLEQGWLELFESVCPGISEDYQTGAEDRYHIRDPEIKDREINQINAIFNSYAISRVEWKKVNEDKTFTDGKKVSGYIFEESVHRVHMSGIMTDADDTNFGYSNKMTFGDAAEITCRFMSGMTLAY